MKRLILFILMFGFLTACSPGDKDKATRWRGPEGNGVYPDKELLKSWPTDGPEVLWTYEELGEGYSSAVAQNGFVFTSGMIDSTGYLFKFTLDGDLLYKIPYGLEHTLNYKGTRGSPVIVEDKVYLVSGRGKLVCFNNEDGNILWSKDFMSDFGGKPISWGINETPVVDGNAIYLTPGGEEYNIIALNRHTGDLIWNCAGLGEPSAYCTPLLFEHLGRKILSTHTAAHLLGIDAQTGKMLWSFSTPGEWPCHPSTPVYNNGELYYFSGNKKGGGKVRLNSKGDSISQIWEHNHSDHRLGGAVFLDGYLYTSYTGQGRPNKFWICIDWETGEEMFKSQDIPPGNIIYADGMFYCYSINGKLSLVKPDTSKLNIVSQTAVKLGSGWHRAHQMIHQGVLFVRHGKAMIAYKIN